MTKAAQFQGPLAGLTVIDFGHYYAGPIVGMMLADQGATVIRIARPGEPELPSQQYRLINRNKKLLTLDLKSPKGKATALSLIENADVLIENFRPGVMKRLGLDYASVKQNNTALVYLSLPGFASTDNHRASIQAWEGIINAASGVYTDTSIGRQSLGYPPVYSYMPQASLYGATHGAIAVMAALVSREAQGRGSLIETPLADAAISGFTGSVVLPAMVLRALANLNAELPDMLKPYAYSPDDDAELQERKISEFMQNIIGGDPFNRYYRCADGRDIFVHLAGIPHFVDRFINILGIDNIVKSEGFVYAGFLDPHGLNNNLCDPSTRSPERALRLKQLISERLRTKSAFEWESLMVAARLPVAVIRTRDEWMDEPELMQSGVFTQMDNGQSRLTVPGRSVDVSGPDDALMKSVFEEARHIDEADACNLFAAPRDAKEPSTPRPPVNKGELLKGLKVLDLSNVIAGPTTTYSLAQYGADVIRLEPPDGLHHPYLLKVLVEVMQGKRSVLADINTAPGRELFRRLVCWADVVVHNSLDETAQRLGVSHKQLRDINPRIISCQLSAFGGSYRGGWEHRLGFDWLAQSASGLLTRYGSLNNPQPHGGTSTGDTITGMGMAFAALIGVYQQRKTGYAGEARTSLGRMNNHIQLPLMISHNGCSDWGEAHGQFAVGENWWQRLYQCSDGWVYVGTTEARSATMTEIVVGQKANDVKELEAAFEKQPCAYWEETLIAHAIPCHKVLTINDICDSRRIRAVANEETAETATDSQEIHCYENHPCGYPIIVMAPTWVRVGEQQSYKRLKPSSSLGQDTVQVLRELGYKADEIDQLIRIRAVYEYLPELGKNNYFFEPNKKGS